MRVKPVSGLLTGHGARFALRSLANAGHGTPSSETLCSRRRPGHPEDPVTAESFNTGLNRRPAGRPSSPLKPSPKPTANDA